MKIMTIKCDTNYSESISLKKLVTDRELDSYKALAGRDIDFGEYCGKYSEVEGSYYLEDIKVEEVTDEVARVIEKHIGLHISGEDYFDYYEITEKHDEGISFILENMPSPFIKTIKEIIAKDEEERGWRGYDEFELIAKSLSLATIIRVEKELDEDGMTELPDWLLKEIENGLGGFSYENK